MLRELTWLRPALLAAILTSSGSVHPSHGATNEEWNDVVATLTAEDREYRVGEPVALKLVIRNDGGKSVTGFFSYAPFDRERSELHTGPRAGNLARFELWSRADGLRNAAVYRLRSPIVLEPNAEFESRVFVVAEGSSGRWALAEPGEYDFQVVLRPFPEHPERLLVSNRAGVRVDAVPDAEKAAFGEYRSSSLAEVIRSPKDVTNASDRTRLRTAAEFCKRHAGSIYAAHVRDALLRVLSSRIKRNEATAEQKEIYELLDRTRTVQ